MTDEAPITVRNSAAPDLIWQAVRALIIFGSGALASRAFSDATVVGLAVGAATAVAAALPAAVAYGFGVYKALTSHHQKKVMASRLPDSVATVVT